MKPCMTTSPASVPTEELARPAMRRPRPKETAAIGPNASFKPLYATSKSSTTTPCV